MKKYIPILLMLVFAFVSSCDDDKIPSLVSVFSESDRVLPELVSIRTEGKRDFQLSFSEDVRVMDVRINSVKATHKYLTPSEILVSSSKDLSVSEESELRIYVSDRKGNSALFSLNVHAKNMDIPKFLITEISPRWSDTQPERIELEFHGSGNTEGIYISDGTKGNENTGISLPSIDVNAGDYIVLYWRIEPKEEETTNSASGKVHHIYVDSDSALGSNNGVVCAYENKSDSEGLLDAVVYSDFMSTTYSGYGSARIEKSVEDIENDFEWFGLAVDVSNATTTRTIQRYPGKKDTNTPADFYISATKGVSFGESNSGNIYMKE